MAKTTAPSVTSLILNDVKKSIDSHFKNAIQQKRYEDAKSIINLEKDLIINLKKH